MYFDVVFVGVKDFVVVDVFFVEFEDLFVGFDGVDSDVVDCVVVVVGNVDFGEVFDVVFGKDFCVDMVFIDE